MISLAIFSRVSYDSPPFSSGVSIQILRIRRELPLSHQMLGGMKVVDLQLEIDRKFV